jgi:hypothetical protein
MLLLGLPWKCELQGKLSLQNEPYVSWSFAFRIEYFDDMATDSGSSMDLPPSPSARHVYEPAAIALKNLHLMGITLLCDEFPASHRTFSREASFESKVIFPFCLNFGFYPLFYCLSSSLPLFHLRGILRKDLLVWMGLQ